MRGCRECADNAGTCPHDGQPCGSTTDVVEAFAEYLERHRRAGIISFPERIVWQDACKCQQAQYEGRIRALRAEYSAVCEKLARENEVGLRLRDKLAAFRRASPVGEPVATATAKRIEWAETTPPGQWDDTRYGFTITHNQDEDEGYRYHASWGEGPEDSFATLEEAQQWCQEQADDLVRDWAIVDSAPPAVSANKVPDDAVLNWAVERWNAEVSNRPLINIHRRSLDGTWRQVIRKCGGDDIALIGPTHDQLIAAAAPKPGEQNENT